MSDISSALFILLYLLVASLAWLVPLALYLKSIRRALPFSIPVSISAQIIIGYVFYNLEQMAYFPLFYLILVVVSNIFAIAKLKKIKLEKVSWRGNTKLILVASLIILPALFYTRYFDAISFVAPGNSDTINHMFFLESIDRIGRIGLSYYAPGLQILAYPLTKLFSSLDIYRFAGPAIGISFALQLILFFWQHTKNKLVFLLATILFISPLYNQLALQTVSFWSSSLSFIFLLGIIQLLVENKIDLSCKSWLCLIIIAGLSFTVPYLFVQLIPALALLYIICRICRKYFSQESFQNASRFFAISLIGFILAFGHITLQAKLSNASRVIPTIRVAVEEDGEIRTATSRNIYMLYPGLEKYEKYPLFRKTLPALSITIDLFNIKNIRGFSSALDIGSYIWLTISLYLVLYAIRKRSLDLLTVATLSLMFGFATQTGILELSYYRGRSGWYLMLFSLLGLVLFFDSTKQRGALLGIIEKTAYLAVAVLVAFSFISPPTFYRKYYPQIYKLAREVGKGAGDQDVVIYNNALQKISLSMVSPNIESFSLEDFLLGQACCRENKQYYLVLEKEFLSLDPKLSQSALSTDKGYEQFYQKQQELRDQKNSIKKQVLESERFSGYKPYFDDEDIAIYKLEK
jgi:hypothetical protein